MAGIVEETGKVATAAVGALSGAPIVIGLLLVNIAFLGFTAYILGEVSGNSSERNKAQLAMINDLVHDIRDCRGGVQVPRSNNTNWTIEEINAEIKK
jgi:hypothetical protein